MPRKRSSRPPNKRSVSKLVSTIKAKASRLRSKMRKPRPVARAAAPAPVKPVARKSVVRKPARGPTVRAARPAAPRSERRTSPKTVQRSQEGERRRAQQPAGPDSAPVAQTTARPGTTLPDAPPGSWSHVPRASVEEQFSIPSGYGDDRITLMVKDPWWLYAYWEIQPATERAARTQLSPQEIVGLQSVLRVHDVTGIDYPSQPSHRSFDIALSGLATNWYIQTNAPDRSFIAELGLLTSGGRFLLLARSNRVTAPRFGPSDVIDEAWATSEELYWKLFGTTAGVGMGSSPSGWAHLLSQQMLGGGSSASLFGQSRHSAVQGFWCRADTDLIIHGATEPRSTVIVQGQPVTVRKDGTFSLRVALPEGTQSVTIEATSPDGRHTKTVTPVVTLAWAGRLDSQPPGTGAPSSHPHAGPHTQTGDPGRDEGQGSA